MSSDNASLLNDGMSLFGSMGGIKMIRMYEMSYQLPFVQKSVDSRKIISSNQKQKIDSTVQSVENFLEGKGKIITNADGDMILMRDNKKIRFDVKNPHGDKPHFHLEKKKPNGRWVDTSSEHRYYFKGD